MSTTRSAPRWAVVLAGALLGLIVVAAAATPASAHASLVETTPFDGQELSAAPEEVVLTFDEPVVAPTGGLRVYDGDGERVDSGIQREVTTDAVAVALPDDLDDGAYVATYRVVSEDGHVIRGAFVFEVGEGQAVDEDTLAALFAGGGDGLLAVLAGTARAVTYVGVLLLAGAAAWLLVVARSDADADEARRWARRGVIAALVATLVAVPLQAMLASGLGFAALSNTALLGETFGGSVGLAAWVRGVGLAVSLVVLTRPRWLLLPTGVALLSFLLDGHTRTVEPAWLMLVGDAAHLAAGAVWFGGVVLLGLAVRRRRLEDDPVGAATVVARFSWLATWAVGVVVVAGSAMSWANVRQPRALTSTDYGWTLLVKVGLVAGIGLLGLYNNRRLVPAVRTAMRVPAGGSSDAPSVAEDATSGTDAASVATPGAQAREGWRRLAATTRWEALAMVAVLGVTAFLVNLRPAAEAAGITGAFDAYVDVTDDLSVNLVVDPNRAGRNEVHLYVFDETGRPLRSEDLEALTLELELPERDLGPITRTPYVAGPGHWQLDGSDLALPGAWEITVQLDVDRLIRERVTIPVVVNP